MGRMLMELRLLSTDAERRAFARRLVEVRITKGHSVSAVRTRFARGRYIADGIGKTCGRKHRPHLALLSRPSQRTAANRFASLRRGCRCQAPVNSGIHIEHGLSHADMTVCHSRARFYSLRASA